MRTSFAFAALVTLFGSVACGQIDASSKLPPSSEPPTTKCATPACPVGSHSTVAAPIEVGEGESCASILYCTPDDPAECLGDITCGAGQLQVPEGSEGAHSVTYCGTTIWCIADEYVNCLGDIACAEDEIQVDAGTENARQVTYCGTTIYCAPNGQIECQGMPECQSGEVEVAAGTAGSYEAEWCGHTISCLPGCEALDGGAAPPAP